MKRFFASVTLVALFIGFSYASNACGKEGKCVGKENSSCCVSKASAKKACCAAKSSSSQASKVDSKTIQASDKSAVVETPATQTTKPQESTK